jgi:hypothetical protein
MGPNSIDLVLNSRRQDYTVVLDWREAMFAQILYSIGEELVRDRQPGPVGKNIREFTRQQPCRIPEVEARCMEGNHQPGRGSGVLELLT